MRSESAYLRRFKNPYRPAYEAGMSILWMAAFFYTIWLGAAGVLPFSCVLALNLAVCAMIFLRFLEGMKILNERSLLSGYRVSAMDYKTLHGSMRPGEIFIGLGYQWTRDHTQKGHDLEKTDPRRWMLPHWMQKVLGRHHHIQPDTEIGSPWLHGLHSKEMECHAYQKIFEGGCLILGTTQAGKGVMIGFLVSQAILRGDVVIVIDPKSSSRLKKTMEDFCAIAGRELKYFHPAMGKDSIAINPMVNWNNPSEAATRIVSVMPSESKGPFKSFAWAAVNTIAQALVYLGEMPSVAAITRNIDMGIAPIAQRSLEKFYKEYGLPPNWRDQACDCFSSEDLDRMGPNKEFLLMQMYYKKFVPENKKIRTIDSLMKVAAQNPEHYEKLVASLTPVLEMLTSGALEKLLSPNPMDDRPSTDLEEIIHNEDVLLLCLDSLTNSEVANAIAALILADLASLSGKRYNLNRKDRKITLIVDEASNVMCQPMIEILNKGAEGGISTTCAMQTIADLAHKLGSEHAARMVLGNLNNLIAFRSKDRPTQDFITETFGKTYISQVDTTFNSHASTAPSAPAFDAGASHSRKHQRLEIVPSEYLGQLPNCQYFASVGGRILFKGRVPILVPECGEDK